LSNRFIAKREKLYQKFIKSILTFIIIVIGVYAALSQFEIARTISTSLLQSGSLIIAVATFAAQQALGNVISGFFISATKPCEIGQKVKIMSGGNVIAEGIVRDMTVRHIFIEQFDGQSYIVPNSLADSSVIVNTNFVEDVGNYIEIEVGYDTDVEEARKIQFAVNEIITLLCSGHGNMYAMIKEVLKLRKGLNVGSVRSPLSPLTEADLEIAKKTAKVIDETVARFV